VGGGDQLGGGFVDPPARPALPAAGAEEGESGRGAVQLGLVRAPLDERRAPVAAARWGLLAQGDRGVDGQVADVNGTRARRAVRILVWSSRPGEGSPVAGLDELLGGLSDHHR
jgi:hypothetical protein